MLGFRLMLPTLLGVILLSACGGDAAPADPAPAPPPPPDTAPEVPDPDPRPSGPNRFRGIENPSDEERAAWHEMKNPGTLALRVVDAGTGDPIAECSYGAFQFAFTREDVDRRLPVQVDGIPSPEVVDGAHPFPLAEGWWRIKVWTDDYRSTWTPRLEIKRDQTTEVTLSVKLLNRLVAEVFDPDGKPLAKGVLLIRSGEYKGTLTIRDGVGNSRLPLDELRLLVDRRFDGMEDFREMSWPVTLRYGDTTEVTIRLEAP